MISVLYSLEISTYYCHNDTVEINKILSKYLENSANGRYLGWEGNRNDSLWINPTDYIEKIKSFGNEFRLVQSNNCYFTLSYSLDSINVFKDHAFGYVTLNAVANGYVIDLLKIDPHEVNKRYLLVKKDNRWYLLSETKDWFVSVKSYVKWANNALKNRSWENEEKYKINTINNLHNMNSLLTDSLNSKF
ncbi:MAG: hypothetical protein GYA51_18400 [Candidatus Methanofastidiosa archaeon]|nr:hypothetical protein [Candidatus Methanofastidiosa archaeon]